MPTGPKLPPPRRPLPPKPRPGPGLPPALKAAKLEPPKRGPGRPRKVPLPPNPHRNKTFDEAFPTESGPSQIKFNVHEGAKLLGDDEHYFTLILDRGAFVNLWGMVRAEVKRHWGSTMSDQIANKRAIKAFEQCYKEANES
jgi:hypothetical protein